MEGKGNSGQGGQKEKGGRKGTGRGRKEQQAVDTFGIWRHLVGVQGIIRYIIRICILISASPPK